MFAITLLLYVAMISNVSIMSSDNIYKYAIQNTIIKMSIGAKLASGIARGYICTPTWNTFATRLNGL